MERKFLNFFILILLKKIKGTGLNFNISSDPSLWADTILVPSVESLDVAKTVALRYKKQLSSVITNCKITNNNKLYVLYVGRSGNWSVRENIFYLRCLTTNQREVYLDITLGHVFETYIKEFPIHPKLATEDGVKRIYSRIDDVAKAIRLVPFGK